MTGPVRKPIPLINLRLELIVLLAISVVVLGKGINQAPLVDWDEATYAEVAHEAITNHAYFDFTWNGSPYLKKPPLLFWMVVASFKTFGESEFAARLPSVLMGVGTLLLTYAMAAEEFGRLAGLLAGLLPLGFYFFVARGGRECATDAPMLFFSTLAIFGLTRARHNRAWAGVIGLACGLAILSKGLAGVIPLTVVVLSIVVLPAFSSIGIIGLGIVGAITMVVAAPWFVYQAIHNGALFWSTYIEQETVMRVAKHLEDHPHGSGFTLRIFGKEMHHLWPLALPLAGLTTASVIGGFGHMLRRVPVAVVVWGLWLVLALGAACAVQTKLGWYVLPALIPVALIGAAIIAGAFMQTGTARLYCGMLAVAALGLLVLTAIPDWARIGHGFMIQRQRSRPSYEMALRARALAAQRGGGELYFAGIPLPTLVYYSGMRCHFVTPTQPQFELTELGGNPISVGSHDMVLVDQSGAVVPVDNLNDEWNRSGPDAERARPVAPARPAPE